MTCGCFAIDWRFPRVGDLRKYRRKEGEEEEEEGRTNKKKVKSRMERVNISLKMVVRKLPENEARVLLMEH